MATNYNLLQPARANLDSKNEASSLLNDNNKNLSTNDGQKNDKIYDEINGNGEDVKKQLWLINKSNQSSNIEYVTNLSIKLMSV